MSDVQGPMETVDAAQRNLWWAMRKWINTNDPANVTLPEFKRFADAVCREQDAERVRLEAENRRLRDALLDIAARTKLVAISGLGGVGADVYAMAKIALASTEVTDGND